MEKEEDVEAYMKDRYKEDEYQMDDFFDEEGLEFYE